MSVPEPLSPTVRAALLVHLEPLPLTVTVPVEPELTPRKPCVLFTCPPDSIESEPVPELPIVSEPVLHVEFVPVTVTEPDEPVWLPILPLLESVHCPPASMRNVPVPLYPMQQPVELDKVEPSPEIVAEPVEPAFMPR